MNDRLERALSDVGRRWVPDPRLGVFEVALTAGNGGGGARLAGTTTSREALTALQRLGASTGLALDVSLLPLPAVRREPVAVVTPTTPTLCWINGSAA